MSGNKWQRFLPVLESNMGEFDRSETDVVVGQLEPNTSFAKLKAAPGVYVLLAKGNSFPKIKRHDPMGILYIGKAINLSRRLDFRMRSTGFWTGYNLNGPGRLSVVGFNHSCLTFCLDFDAKKKELVFDSHLLNPGSMLVGAKPLLSIRYDVNPDQLETDLLHEHFDKFGCLPPFNSTGTSLKSFFKHGKSTTKLLDELKSAFDGW